MRFSEPFGTRPAWTRRSAAATRALAGAALAIAAAACGGGPGREQELPPAAVIPQPVTMEVSNGVFTLSRKATLRASGGEAALNAASYFADLMRRTAGFDLEVLPGGGLADAGVVFALDPAGPPHVGAYRIEVAADRAHIVAATPEGLFYGAATFWQLATPASEEAARIRTLKIEDAPGFSWRGVMLDSARHYQSPAFIKRFIDLMALHKLNVFHWHLTDDQAWRLEIRKHPALTDVGAFRVPAGEAERDLDPQTGEARRYGGYYTQEEVREIVAHAKSRFVTIVPEIDMPGHVQAATVAYPALAAGKTRPQAVSSDWGVFPDIFNVEEGTFAFLEDVLEETAALFPGPFIHVGGDEVVKDRWREDPAVQARMKAFGIEDETALQGYFTRRIGGLLAGMNRRLVGWDEILEGGLADSAVVMSWRGVEGAIEAARKGYETVLSPAPDLYFDNRQSALNSEPPGRGNVISLESVYRFNPYPEELSRNQRSHIRGVQANIWTEHIRTEARVEHMTFPRIAALAEIAWTPGAEKDWPRFLDRLALMLARYDALGVNYARSAFMPRIEVERADDGARVRLDTQAGYGEIRYTLDGAAPGADSPVYHEPLFVDSPVILTAATFIAGRTVASASDRIDGANHLRRKSQELRPCAGDLVLNLEDDAPLHGPRAVFLVDIMNPCWIFEDAELSGVTEIEAAVGQVPFNFQIGEAIEHIQLAPPRTPYGELEARLACDGEVLTSLSLEPAHDNPGVTLLRGAMKPVQGRHDLCLRFTGETIDPLWVLDEIRLTSGERETAQ